MRKIYKKVGESYMLKGICKQFITVKIKNHKLYEEAIFVLKDNKQKLLNDSELVFEANRILCENGIKSPQKRRKRLKKLLFSSILLLSGALIGAAITIFITK